MCVLLTQLYLNNTQLALCLCPLPLNYYLTHGVLGCKISTVKQLLKNENMNTRQKNIINEAMSKGLKVNNTCDDDSIQEAINELQTSIDTDDYELALDAFSLLMVSIDYRLGTGTSVSFGRLLNDLKSYNSLAEAVINKNLQASAYLESLAMNGNVIRIM